MRKEKSVAWGVLGLGAIARKFSVALAECDTARLVAVGSRKRDSAERFGREFPGVRTHDTYEALLADPEVEAVYIATPHPLHAEWVIKSAEAGKHILCEKPAALNFPEAMAMIQAVREHGVFFMEAFMYRCHPQTARIVAMIREGAIGAVSMMEASFGFASRFDPASRLWSNELAGGGIMDVGCYPVSMSRLVAGAAVNRPFANPEWVRGGASLHPKTGVDQWAAAVLGFEGGILAQVTTSIAVRLENRVRIFGTEGRLEVAYPWKPEIAVATPFIELWRGEAAVPEKMIAASDRNIYALEAEAVGRAIRDGKLECDAMPWDDTLGNLQTLDQWREQAGLRYTVEEPQNWSHTVSRRPLRRRAEVKMPMGRVPFLDKEISRFVLGCDNQRTQPMLSVLCDAWFERGGNAFDTAFSYLGGSIEKRLGWWLRHRGVREQVVLLVKGGHTPFCDPASVLRQFEQSLDRLQTDYADVYFLHRDNPDIPVSEFVDALVSLVQAGRIRAYGGSNWSIERLEQARAYAAQHRLQPMTAVSNNLSLARMLNPVWAGCVTASDPASRAWFEKHRVPLFAWSSQARGYFLDASDSSTVQKRSTDEEMARCWDSAENRERRSRARALAAEKGCKAVHIAAAYVLYQPFPSFALFGPRTIAELVDSLRSLDVTLTPTEVEWLDLRRDSR